jgi:hypothetical protein
VHVDAARAPRDGGALIAGEAIRVGMRITGGAPPYRVSMSEPAIRAEPAEVPAQSNTGVELAIGGVLSPDTSSGTHRLIVTVTDTAGATATTNSPAFDLIGEGAELEKRSGGVPPPYVEITDAASRRRKTFVRGETVTVTATLGRGVSGPVSLAFRAPDKTILTRAKRLKIRKGAVSVPINVPRLAIAGDYWLEFKAGYISVSVPLRVRGEPFAAVAKLTVDELLLRGGTDLRAARPGELTRGETLEIEARIGGAKRSVAATLRLRDNRGKLIEEVALGTSDVAAASASARVYVGGEWQVPASIPSGRYQIEIEVTEQDDVSARFREVHIR